MSANFDKRIIVISDIHMSASGAGIFRAGAQLKSFIDYHASLPEALELVILGDALDYLTIEPYLQFTRKVALKKTEAILDGNAGIFAALSTLLEKPGKTMLWVIGNHDIELLFPEVRALIEGKLFGGAAAHPGFRWKLDGTSEIYKRAGGSEVRLNHGNQLDDFNKLDYAAAEAIARQGGKDDFEYPAGSRLVADVLNPLKSEGYWHVDLLKPEVTVALPLTLALWPKRSWERIKKAIPSMTVAKLRGAWSSFTHTRGAVFGQPLPSDKPKDAQAEADERARLALANGLFLAAHAPDADEKLKSEDIKEYLENSQDIEEYLKNLPPDVPTARKDVFGVDSKRTASMFLRGAAARANREDNPLSVDLPDEFCEAADRAFVKGTIIMVAGHTHLARAIPRNGGYYLNTGTWADLMRLPAALSEAEFNWAARELVDAFKAPEKAPWYLRPFKRLTYVDLDPTQQQSGATLKASLKEWPHEPAPNLLFQFP